MAISEDTKKTIMHIDNMFTGFPWYEDGYSPHHHHTESCIGVSDAEDCNVAENCNCDINNLDVFEIERIARIFGERVVINVMIIIVGCYYTYRLIQRHLGWIVAIIAYGFYLYK